MTRRAAGCRLPEKNLHAAVIADGVLANGGGDEAEAASRNEESVTMNLLSTITASIALSALGLAAVPQAKAASCNSAAKVSADVWKEYGTVAKGMGCVLATALSQGAVDTIKCLETANKYDKSVQSMISFWNKMADNSWATIGPRRMDIGVTSKGKLVSTGGRVFVSAAPLADDKVEIKLKKTDGKAKTTMAVCKEAPNGKRTKLWDLEIDNGKDNVGKTWTKTISGLKGYVLVTHLDAGSVTNTFSYELTAKPR